MEVIEIRRFARNVHDMYCTYILRSNVHPNFFLWDFMNADGPAGQYHKILLGRIIPLALFPHRLN
jgi:hypothetical protein